MTIADEIGFYNDVFYHAFLDRDMESMTELWGKDGALLCIHPGGVAITDRVDILESWAHILESDNCPQILHKTDQLVSFGDLMLMTCFEWAESQPDNVLLVTNGFIKQSGIYKMVMHQAGPSAISALDVEEELFEPRH